MKNHVQTIFVAIGLGIKRNWHIFLAIILGVIFGNYIHAHSDIFSAGIPALFVKLLNVIGQAFIRLIQMIVIPLVCSAIVVGISSIGDSKQIGQFGKKMIIYYAIIKINRGRNDEAAVKRVAKKLKKFKGFLQKIRKNKIHWMQILENNARTAY